MQPVRPARSICKHGQQGDAGAALLVIMVVLMGVWFWHGDRWHSGERSHMSGPTSTTTQEKTALDLLDEAYARGDIAREEYLRKRDDLLRR
jgi:uncharacterized membrane protein